MIDLKDCIKVTKMIENEDGSADVEFEYTETFVDLYKAATGKKKATKKNLKKYLYKMLEESSKVYKEGGGIPCVIPIENPKKPNFSPKEVE